MVCPWSAVGAGVGLGAKSESAEGPAEEEHRSRDEHRLATDFSADRGSVGSPQILALAWGLGVHCALLTQAEKRGVIFFPLK